MIVGNEDNFPTFWWRAHGQTNYARKKEFMEYLGI